jgi:tellurite resistance protein TerC
MSPETLLWIGFAVFVIVMMSLDLGVFHRKAHEVKFKEALIWTIAWVLLALCFNVGIYIHRGQEAAMQFLTAYLLEESLSIDNLFVFLLIFTYFKVPARYQHRVLFWGILGVLIMRGAFISLGLALIHRFEWILYLFGAMLVFTGFKLAFEKDKEVEFEHNPILNFFRRIFLVSKDYEGGKFFVRQGGHILVTPLFIILMFLNTVDLIFAVDSIPAVMSISQDIFIVFTSNIFAILGLRSLYFVISNIMELFHHLHYGLSLILVFIGVKMLIVDFYHIPTGVSLLLILIVLVLSVIASIVWPKVKEEIASHHHHS